MGGATAYLGSATAYLVGWLETDNRAISVQSNLTGTATGTELGNIISNLILALFTTPQQGTEGGRREAST